MGFEGGGLIWRRRITADERGSEGDSTEAEFSSNSPSLCLGAFFGLDGR